MSATPPNAAQIVRSEFESAFTAALERALRFEGADKYMDELLSLIFKGNFTTWRADDIDQFYATLLRTSGDRVTEVFDFLHELNLHLTAGMAMFGLQPTLDQVIALAFGANRPSAGNTTDTQRPVYQTPNRDNPAPSFFLELMGDLPWMRAVLAIRLFGLRRMLGVTSASKPNG